MPPAPDPTRAARYEAAFTRDHLWPTLAARWASRGASGLPLRIRRRDFVALRAAKDEAWAQLAYVVRDDYGPVAEALAEAAAAKRLAVANAPANATLVTQANQAAAALRAVDLVTAAERGRYVDAALLTLDQAIEVPNVCTPVNRTYAFVRYGVQRSDKLPRDALAEDPDLNAEVAARASDGEAPLFLVYRQAFTPSQRRAIVVGL